MLLTCQVYAHCTIPIQWVNVYSISMTVLCEHQFCCSAYRVDGKGAVQPNALSSLLVVVSESLITYISRLVDAKARSCCHASRMINVPTSGCDLLELKGR